MRVFSTGIALFLLICTVAAGSVLAADSGDLAKQIQKNLGTIKRHIVTQPKNAETELEETFGLLADLKQADPGNDKIPQLEDQLDKLNLDLEKRLGKKVQPVTRSTPPPAPVVATPSPSTAAPPSVVASPAAGSELPSAVASRIKKIDQSLDKAKKALANQSLQRAELEFKNAEKTRAEIQSRYADQAPAEHPEMQALGQRMAAVQTQIASAAGSAAAEKAATEKAASENQALANSWIDQLKPFLSRDSAQYLDQTGWGKGDAEFAKVRENYNLANRLFAEYQRIDFPLGKPMALKNVENQLQSTLKTLSETYAQEDTAKASEGWLARLEPFVTSMGPKNLIASFTSSVEQMQQQKAIYAEAKSQFDAYLKADFPQGKSPQLQQVENELADRLAKFPEVLQRSMGAQAGEAEQKLDQEIRFLNGKNEWRSDSSKRPYCLSEERINESRKQVETAASLLPAGDAGLVRMQDKLASLIKMNDERRKIHADRTRMEPDIFVGDEKGAIKDKAQSLVNEKIRGCRVLRSNVISADWQEESVQEWTDTTHSATRFRTTRSVTAQVAAKKSDGEVRLYTLHVAKDRRSDGSWGTLYGNLHSDLGDLMREENVDK